MSRALRLIGLTALVSASLAGEAIASPKSLAPSGWNAEKDSYTDNWEFTAPGGDDYGEAQISWFSKEAPNEVADIFEMKQRHMQPYGTEVLKSPQTLPVENGQVTMAMYQEEYGSGRYIATAYVGRHKAGGTLTCFINMPLQGNTPDPRIQTFIAKCEAFAVSGQPYDDEQAAKIKKRSEVAALPTVKGKSGKVDSYIFGLRYTYGVGGMVLPEYYPVILYKDGLAVRGLTLAPSGIDPAQFKRAQPDDVGTWKKSGSTYYLSWPDSDEPDEVKGSVDKPKTFRKGHRLNGEWSSIGGGGNTAFGGNTSVAISDSYRFYPDGSFTSGRSVGAVSASGSGWSKRDASGSYSIDGPSLTLSFRDGQTVSTSLFYDGGDSGLPTLWIGGEAFTD